ncbi:MAG: hypothetical protein R3C68_06025 [Myxococcota bacterium]
MNLGIVRETFNGERRVALVPADVALLLRKKVSVVIEAGPETPPYEDAQYTENTVVACRAGQC